MALTVDEWCCWPSGSKLELLNGELIVSDNIAHSRLLLSHILRGWGLSAAIPAAPISLWRETLSKAFGLPQSIATAPLVHKSEARRWADEVSFEPELLRHLGHWRWAYSQLRQNLRMALYRIEREQGRLGESLGGGVVNRLGEDGLMPDIYFYRGEPRNRLTERLPDVVAPWARQTARYREQLKAIALSLGGNAAVRLGAQLGFNHSRNTFLNLLSHISLPPIQTPRILGVDDFALRRGQHYGTILVDIEAHRPIALLPDRTAESLEAWLKAHPGVEILSRDRSKTYRSGMSAGAPDAIQVADRFHLLQNLEETLEKAFQGKSEAIKSVEIAQLQEAGIDLPELPKPNTSRQQRREDKRVQRLENYNQVHALKKQGYKIKDIAHHLGMGKRTVYTYLSHDSFPEWQPPNRQYSSDLDPYKSYLIEQWQQGKRHAKRLFEEIQQHGFTGSYAMVARYLQPLRQTYPPMRPAPESLNDLPGRGPAPKVKRAHQKALSARRVAWLILQRPETLDAEQEQLLDKLAAQPELSEVISLAQGFLDLVRKRLA